MRGAESFMRS